MEQTTAFNTGRWPKADDRSRHEARERLSEMLVRAGRRDEAALEEVYNQTSGKLYALLLEMLAEPAVAGEVLRDCYLTVWHGLSVYAPGRASPVSWLITMARNKAIDRLRGDAAARRSMPLEEPGAEPAPQQPVLLARLEADRDREALYRCLDQLDALQRDAIRTAFFAGMPYDELALRADAPADLVRSRIGRGLSRLNASLQS